MTKASESLETLTTVGQGIVLSISFALAFSWETDFQARALTMIIIILLVLIYPMTDRLNNVNQRNYKELLKSHGATQTLLMDLRSLMPGKAERDNMSSEESLNVAKEVDDELATFLNAFEEGFTEGYENERTLTKADQIDFFSSAFSLVFYLTVLIGTSAVVGWVISLPF